MNKKFLTLIIVISTISSNIGLSTANAKTIDNELSKPSISDTEFTEVNCVMKEETLSKDEYCKRLSEYENISIEEATKRVEARDQQLNSLAKSSSGILYRQITWDRDLVNRNGVRCTVTSGCLATIEYYDSFRYIKACEGPYVKASGNGSYVWQNGYQIPKIVNNGQKLEFYASGVVEGNINVSVTGGSTASVQGIFLSAGFSASIQGSETVYVRKSCEFSHYYDAYNGQG